MKRPFAASLSLILLMGICVAEKPTFRELFKDIKEARQKQAKYDMMAYQSALALYKINHNRYPNQEEGLQALVSPNMLKQLVKDPWKQDYIYRFPGSVEADEPEIISAGPDGKLGTDDDISSQKDL